MTMYLEEKRSLRRDGGGAFWVACEWALGMRLKTEERVEKEWFRRGEETRSVKTCLLAPGSAVQPFLRGLQGTLIPVGTKPLFQGMQAGVARGPGSSHALSSSRRRTEYFFPFSRGGH